MLQVIVFALFVGIILAKLGERVEVVSNFFAQFNDIMMEMTNMVMMAAPIGVYCLIARTFSNIGFRDLFRWQNICSVYLEHWRFIALAVILH